MNLLYNVQAIIDLMEDEASRASDESPHQRQSPFVFTERHILLKLQLLPLRQIQKDLEKRPSADSQDTDRILDVLAGSAQAIQYLWEDNIVQEMLTRRQVKMDTLPGLSVHDLILCLVITDHSNCVASLQMPCVSPDATTYRRMKMSFAHDYPPWVYKNTISMLI